MSNTTWSKTAARRRLATAARLARKACGQPTNVRVEVGRRTIPTSTQVAPTVVEDARALAYPEGDDLAHYDFLDQAAEYVVPGDVVHMYVSESARPGDEPYLCDIVVVWLGNDDSEPVVIDPRFRTFPTSAEKFVAEHFVVIPVKI